MVEDKRVHRALLMVAGLALAASSFAAATGSRTASTSHPATGIALDATSGHGPGFWFTPVSALAPVQAAGQLAGLQWQSGRSWAQDLGEPATSALPALDYAKFGEFAPPQVTGTGYPMAASGQSALAYFEQYHPDWIMYQADRTTVAYYGSVGNGYVDTSVVPLDVANPAVQAYIVATTLDHALQYGYTGILFDHGTVLNKYDRVGHYSTTGAWVQEYSGIEADTVYCHAIVTAFAAVEAALKAGARAAGVPTFTVGINDPPDLKWEPTWWAELAGEADVVYDENGFTKNVTTLEHVASSSAQDPTEDLATTNPWLTIVHDYQQIQADGKAMIMNSFVDYPLPAGSTPTPADVNWILGNYMAIDEPDTTLNFIGPGTPPPGEAFLYLPYQWVPAYAAAIGYKAGNLTSLGNGAYSRQFTSGLVFVNPSLASVTVNVPAGYQTLYGVTEPAGATPLTATSALVLVKA